MRSGKSRTPAGSDGVAAASCARRRHRALAIAALGASLLGVATAQAQVDPYATAEEQAKTSDLDTDLTPVAKQTDLWTLAHGAEYPETQVIDGSATTFDTDLFDVAFRDRAIGLAGGSVCAVEPVRQSGESEPVFGARVAQCRGTENTQVPRVPVLYRYVEPPDADPRWEKLDLPGADQPGYIGAIAWIDAARALIVGGTGSYPRREGEPDDTPSTNPDKPDEAGAARAWIYERSSDEVEELDLAALRRDTSANGAPRAGMRGLTGVDCYTDPTPGQVPTPGGLRPDPNPDLKLCFAGGLGQVWEWRNGAFESNPIDALSADSELADAEHFLYRVRDIAFGAGREPPVAVAATAGCCATDTTLNKPRILEYGESSSPQWSVRALAERATLPDPGELPESIAIPPPAQGGPIRQAWDEFCATHGCTVDVPGGGQPLLPNEVKQADRRRRAINDTPQLPDSIYSIFGSSAILTPGGREAAEKPSLIMRRRGAPAPEADLLRTALGTARLLDGDGDVAGTDAYRPSGSGNTLYVPTYSPPNRSPDSVPDWVVGELRSTTRAGLGARGLVVATALGPSVVDPINASYGTSGPITNPELELRPTPEDLTRGYAPVDQGKLDAFIASQHHLLPSYTANAVEIVGEQEDGWAVGDHGAILRISTEGLRSAEGAAEPKPPTLGAPRRDELADASAYQESREELPPQAGRVPALGDETLDLREPLMATAGNVGGRVTEIVMSRDGSEGWAIGTDPAVGTTFSRFDGVGWRRCDPLGIAGQVEPDPACEAMAPLQKQRISLTHAARVPLESDIDPTNDDELEIIAARISSGAVTFVRYSEGRWRLENPQVGVDVAQTYQQNSTTPTVRIVDLAVASPSDGWLATSFQTANGAAIRLHRFNGDRWVQCWNRPFCGDMARVPPWARDVAGLATAGARIYLYGSRATGAECTNATVCMNPRAPLIIYRDPGGGWTDGAGEGGFDPAFSDRSTTASGEVRSLSVAAGEGGYEGWAVGEFGGISHELTRSSARVSGKAALMRLSPGSEAGWKPFRSPGAFDDYMLPSIAGYERPSSRDQLQVLTRNGDGEGVAFIGQEKARGEGNRIFAFDDVRQRFEMVRSPRPQAISNLEVNLPAHPQGEIDAMGPDGRGGFWAAINGQFLHHTLRPPKPLFEEVADPLGRRSARLRGLDAGEDGSVWVATDSDRFFRYDRLLGWDEGRVPGWDPGRVVTRPSAAHALAIGPDGQGLLVGDGGRIAELSPTGAVLDRAAGRSCALGDAIPCGTSRALRAVDIAPDGSAIAVGDKLAVLWRPAGGDFRAISPPPVAGSSSIIATSYPTPSRAYVVVQTGGNRSFVFRGELSGQTWSWRTEIAGDSPLLGAGSLPLAAIAIDGSGHGYAVGHAGLVLERTEGGGWRRLSSPARENLTAVDLAHGGSEAALIGGTSGLILTAYADELRVARPADYSLTPPISGHVAGFAYLPGSTEGTVDAWAGVTATGQGDARILRYRSEPEGTAQALADAPALKEGELSLAAFGKADCDKPANSLCPELTATTTTNEVISERIVYELTDTDAPVNLAVLTGDAVDSAGRPGSSLTDLDRIGSPAEFSTKTQLAGQLKHRRVAEALSDPLDLRGISLLAAIGMQDLSETYECGYSGCYTTKQYAKAGENFAWREAFADRTEPWGDGSATLPPEEEPAITFEPAPGSEDNSLRVESQSADADGDEGIAPEAKAEIGGANTHYAVDAVKDGDAIARIVFVDTSLRSLQASDALQQPHELAGGQQRFLERMICTEGGQSTFGDGCTRGKDQKAIVVSNTPTYSYGPGALTHTALDGTTFEATMLRYDVDLVISGALGYNGLYYTLAPGVHEPCPGGEYPEAPPSGKTPDCLTEPTGPADEVTKDAPADPASLISEQGLTGAYPTLIASGAGGKFGPDGNEPPDGPTGQWHGYSVARLLLDGDLAIEQRAILDWIGMDAPDHAVPPRSRLRLNGYGRSPISTTTEGQQTRAFHYEISNPAITHRYDLLLADPDEPWLPCDEEDVNCQELHANLTKPSAEAEAIPTATGEDNSCSPYLCLPPRIGVVDDQSGQIRAGDGKYPETFAIAMLSVDEEVATYPLVFKRSPAFVTSPSIRTGALPQLSGARPGAPPPPPPPPGLPQIPQVDIPQIPPPPGIPQLSAATPPELQPPAPPAPPPPSQQPAPLDLSVAPPGVSISTPTALIQPPTPPVNPAPPGGARREARQRQAAAQKGGADSDEASGDAQDLGGDKADAPHGPGHAATRHQFTALANREQASAWTQGLAWGGGLTLAGFVLAAGFSTLRPGSRRREPQLPAPALSTAVQRRRGRG